MFVNLATYGAIIVSVVAIVLAALTVFGAITAWGINLVAPIFGYTTHVTVLQGVGINIVAGLLGRIFGRTTYVHQTQ